MNGVNQIGIYLRQMRRLKNMPNFPIEYSGVLFHCPYDFLERLHFLENNGIRMCEYCFFRTARKSSTLYTVPLRSLPSDISLARPTSKEDFLKDLEATSVEMNEYDQ